MDTYALKNHSTRAGNTALRHWERTVAETAPTTFRGADALNGGADAMALAHHGRHSGAGMGNDQSTNNDE